MNKAQSVVTGSFVVVGGYLVVKHKAIAPIIEWLGAPPAATTAAPRPKAGGLQDWQAAIVAYTALLMVGATAAGPLAEVIAVGLAVGTGIQAANLLAQQYPQLVGGVSAANNNLPAAGATEGRGNLIPSPPQPARPSPPGTIPPNVRGAI